MDELMALLVVCVLMLSLFTWIGCKLFDIDVDEWEGR